MKSERLVIETPEKIRFSYNLAEVGTRAAAYLIDMLIQGLLLLAFSLLGAGMNLSAWSRGGDNVLYFGAVLVILLFLMQWGYFFFFEALMNGRTPGKKVCRLRVVRMDGERLDIPTLAVRNLLRAADGLPMGMFPLLGGLTALIQKKNRRLGDLAAGTVVVADSVFSLQEPDFTTRLRDRRNKIFARPAEGERLSEKDLYILRRLLNEKEALAGEALEKTAAEVAGKLRERYRLGEAEELEDWLIIEEIYKAHTYEDTE